MNKTTEISTAPPPSPGTAQVVEEKVLFLRGQSVMLDRDLAELYGVTTGALNQAVRRNMTRFPDDFMFVLTSEEVIALQRSRSQFVILNVRRGSNVKYPPLAFTEYGVAMLSSVLRSERAVQVNIEIMRAFGRLRGLAAAHVDIARRLDELEAKTTEHDLQFQAVFKEIRRLLVPAMSPSEEPERPQRQIGFVPNAKKE